MSGGGESYEWSCGEGSMTDWSCGVRGLDRGRLLLMTMPPKTVVVV